MEVQSIVMLGILIYGLFGIVIATLNEKISYEKLILEDLELKKLIAIKVPSKLYTKYLYLDLLRSRGPLDKLTFYYLKDLLSINITDSKIDTLDFETFTCLNNLEVLQFRNSRINVDKNSKAPIENLLTHFRELNFRNSFVADLSRNSFYQLRYLTKLTFDNSEVCNISKDAFYDLSSITHLAITSTEILDYDFSQILKLKSLRYLALYDVRTNIGINYNLLKYLPNLETVLFDPWVYRNLDLEGFPVLRRCELGLRDDSQGGDPEYNAVRTEVVTKLDKLKKNKGIDYVIVYPRGRLVN